MANISRAVVAAAFGVVVGVSSPAFAHGDGKGGHPPAGAVKLEQKPFGIAGDPKKVSRTITIDMTDEMRYFPSSLQLKVGETVRFKLVNKGKTMHELVIGTGPDLQEHAALMKKFPDMEHEEPYMAHVKPGTTGEIVWQFNRPGEFKYVCLLPGHFEAGMVGTAYVK
jgi:uncharacterized cupredoxin-like copper-binding protein